MNSTEVSGHSQLGKGVLFLIIWHIISLPLMVWAVLTGPGGLICGPSNQFIVLFMGVPVDIILLLVSLVRAAMKRKLTHMPLLINLAVVVILILSGVLSSIK